MSPNPIRSSWRPKGQTQAACDMTREFCTYFDSRYLARGLALAESLRVHCPDHRLWVLCLDDASYQALRVLALREVVPIPLEAFEAGDVALLAAKQTRSTIEYYFTCTPSLPLFVLRSDASVQMVTYIDADLFFFSSPEPLFSEMGGRSIAIVPHRFPAGGRHFERYGVYNVGWLTFRRTEEGLACLRWWRERCLEWCFDREEPGRFADQKYLDDWPDRFASVHVIRDAGANVAAWNLANHRVSRGPSGVLIDGEPLIFFHFHHLKRRASWWFETDCGSHRARLTSVLKQDVFTPYFRSLDRHETEAAAAGAASRTGETLRSNGAVIGSGLVAAWRAAIAGNLLVYVAGRVR